MPPRPDPASAADRGAGVARPPEPARLRRAALAYAALGWRVHPCRAGQKTPHLAKWQERATTDQAAVEAWWSQWPSANVGIATGEASGIFVLDVDGVAGETTLAELERRHGPLPDCYPLSRTGNGSQAFFTWPRGRAVRNSAGRLGPNLDTRGAGGYVVAPPSRHPSGRLYRWEADRSPRDVPPEPAPAWLVDLLDPPQSEPEPRRPTRGYVQVSTGNRRALKALEAELALVAIAGRGRRNEALNRGAYALLRFVASGELPAEPVLQGLRAAALHAGLAGQEIEATIASAARARGILP